MSDERSVSFLLNAELLTRSLTNHKTEDFSPAILQYCRILEREFSVKIFNPFKNFLINKYWTEQGLSNYDNFFLKIDNQLALCTNTEDEKLFNRLKSFGKALKGDTTKSVKTALEKNKSFMLGNAIDAFLLLHESSLIAESLILEFDSFIKRELNWSRLPSFKINSDLVSSMFSGDTSKGFEDCLEELRANYRNHASHTSILGEKKMNNTKNAVELLLKFWTGELLK